VINAATSVRDNGPPDSIDVPVCVRADVVGIEPLNLERKLVEALREALLRISGFREEGSSSERAAVLVDPRPEAMRLPLNGRNHTANPIQLQRDFRLYGLRNAGSNIGDMWHGSMPPNDQLTDGGPCVAPALPSRRADGSLGPGTFLIGELSADGFARDLPVLRSRLLTVAHHCNCAGMRHVLDFSGFLCCSRSLSM